MSVPSALSMAKVESGITLFHFTEYQQVLSRLLAPSLDRDRGVVRMLATIAEICVPLVSGCPVSTIPIPIPSNRGIRGPADADPADASNDVTSYVGDTAADTNMGGDADADSDRGTDAKPDVDVEPDADVGPDIGPVDEEGDGLLFPEDCEPTNATAYPGATEVCDQVGND